jgi:dTDP-4-dehydrorhamnose reductase
VGRPAGQAPLEHGIADPVGTGRGRVLITGAGGQLGAALREEFSDADARGHADFDVTAAELEYAPDLVLHAAAWTDVDGAERDPDAAREVNVEGTANVVALGGPVVYFSTDYVFDGSKREPYVESDEPNPLSVYGRSKLDGEREITDGWIVRSSWLFGWTSKNFVRTMLELARKQDEVSVVDDQLGCPTYVGHLAAATRDVLDLPQGVWHLAAEGHCSWAEFARAIFEEADLDCRVIPISTEQLTRPAPRPAYSVLRSERAEAPRLPHWREGLKACLERLKAH